MYPTICILQSIFDPVKILMKSHAFGFFHLTELDRNPYGFWYLVVGGKQIQGDIFLMSQH